MIQKKTKKVIIMKGKGKKADENENEEHSEKECCGIAVPSLTLRPVPVQCLEVKMNLSAKILSLQLL